MEELLRSTLDGLPLIALVAIAAFTLYTLSKGADILVDEAVALSVKWGVPKMIIGATMVVTNITTTYNHVVWFGIVFTIAMISAWYLKQKGL